MTSSRQSILDRIAASAPLYPPSLPIDMSAFEQTEASAAELVALLCERLHALSVTCEVTENAVVARLGLVTYLQNQGVKQILSWANDQLPVPGIVDALDTLGIAVVTPAARSPGPLSPQIDAIDVGLTGVDAALAETGTLVLSSGPGRPLLVSQLARLHIVLTPQSCIFADAAAWLAAQRRSGRLTSHLYGAQVALVTGPSQTVDIELTPAVGVHGPRRLHVIIVQGI